ncbi:HNH endonuclease [Promicromonospora sp. NPDC057488]|uniref:HNH endonuclease signature motif containing protein n=1 Tax=Promicromonospora sp. NPDC057488 TaxID=3346147 RepID=UPI00366ECB26
MDNGQNYEGMSHALLDDDVFAELVRLDELEDRPVWPSDAVPVALWPVEHLRAALTRAIGIRLAQVVAEATDPNAELLAELPDDALGDLVIACGRLQSWAAGLQARAVAERASRETGPLAHSSLVAQVTGELVVTGTEASEVVVRGESGADHPSVIRALTIGHIDVKKAHTLLRSATQLTTEERAEAVARYLPQAPFRTWRWLRSKLLAFAKSRHGSAETARIAAQHRTVQLDRAENDMGWLSAYLPAVDATAVWNVIDDMAHQLRRTAGEDRDLGQLRADCLTGIVTGRLLPANRFAGFGDEAGPGAGADHAVSADGASGSSGSALGPHDCPCGGRAPVQVVRVTPTRPVVRVTVPASVLLGLDDAPGDLDGFGPIPAETARLIATDATWQRLVTDPVTGVLVDYSTTTYQPGKVLRKAVEARDGTCVFPGCDTQAAWCDLDHIEPFDHDQRGGGQQAEGAPVPEGAGRGQTNAWNLQALCRRHHLLKTHAGWGVVRDRATGVTTWTTPSGGTHSRLPTALDTHVELDDVDPGSSYDLTLRSVTRRRLPRQDVNATVEPGEMPTGSVDPASPTGTGQPPF